jgi:hypothetical protein
MYRGKSIQTPQTLFEIRRGGWLSTVLHLWTQGVALPVFELRLTGLLGVLGTWEDYYHPVARVEDSILEAPPPLSDGGGDPAAVVDQSSGMVTTFCGEHWDGSPVPVLPEHYSGDDVPCRSEVSVGNPDATGADDPYEWAWASGCGPIPVNERAAVRRSRRDTKWARWWRKKQ